MMQFHESEAKAKKKYIESSNNDQRNHCRAQRNYTNVTVYNMVQIRFKKTVGKHWQYCFTSIQ